MRTVARTRSRKLLAGVISAAGERRLFADRRLVGLGLTSIIEDVGPVADGDRSVG